MEDNEIIESILIELNSKYPDFPNLNEYLRNIIPNESHREEFLRRFRKSLFTEFNSSTGHYHLNDFGRKFKNKGDYIKYLNDESEIKDLQKRKLKTDVELGEKTVKDYPYTKGISWAAFIISLCLAILELCKYIKAK
jgi:hypothetical protein